MQTHEGKVLVFFDLETTGLGTNTCDIIQISAICGEKDFNHYCLPSQPISEGATKIHGFTVNENYLFLKGDHIPTTPLPKALEAFIEFLSSIGGPVLLVAHNAEGFDVPILSRVLKQNSLYVRFQEVVEGCVDTLPLSRRLCPDLTSCTLINLVEHYLKKDFPAHNAVEDARILQELFTVRAWSPVPDEIQMF